MKKILRILLILIIIIAIALAGGVYFISSKGNQWLSENKSTLEAKASTALKTPVKLGDLQLKVFPKLFVDVEKLSLGEDLSISGIRLDVALADLLKKKIRVVELIIDEPSLKFIKEADGVQIAGLPKQKKKKEKTQSSKKTTNTKEAKKELPDFSFALEKFNLNNATIIFQDGEKIHEINNLDVKAAVDLNLPSLLLKQVDVAGVVKKIGNFGVTVPELKFSLASGDLGIPNILIQLLKISLKSEVDFNVLKQSGIAKLFSDQGQLFAGTLNNTVKLNPDKTFSLSSLIEKIDLALVQKDLKPDSPMAVNGILDKSALDLTGNLGPNLPQSIVGEGNVLLTAGALVGSNLPAQVLSVVTDLPFLAGNLLDAVPEDLKTDIAGPDTAIKSLTIDYNIANAALNTKSLELISTVFSLTGRGTIGFDKSLDLEAEMFFTEAFSTALASKVKEIGKVLDDQGRLVIPVAISGKVGDLTILPNLTKLIELGATRAVQEKIQEKITEKLGDKLDGKAGELLKGFGF